MKGNFVKKEIIRIDVKTGEIKEYPSQYIASLDGFNTTKIGRSCRKMQESHKGYFFHYKENYNKNTYSERLSLNKKPHNCNLFTLLYFNCKDCKQEKYYTNFHINSPKIMGKGRFKGYCKSCQHKKMNDRKKLDIKYRLSCNLRKRLNAALKVKKWNKNNKFKNYIGCTLEQLKYHIESQFKDDMTWENYGKWEIDHIIPMTAAIEEKDLYILSHYQNLQPLWKLDNIRKGGY